MNFKRTIILCIAFIAIHNITFAQSLSMQDFKKTLNLIKTISKYSYTATISAVFPNGKKDTLSVNSYVDINNNSLYYKTNYEQVILNHKWYYRLNHTEKSISIFKLESYEKKYPMEYEHLKNVFKTNPSNQFLEALQSYDIKLNKAVRKDDICTYEIGFNSDSPYKYLKIIFNEKTQLIIQIILKYEELIDPLTNKKTIYEINSKDYKSDFDPIVFNTDKLFKSGVGKITLLKYTNYKLTTVL